MTTMPTTNLFIATPADLATFCAHLRGTPWLALDTEFIREKTYYPRLCLVQVASQEQVACIDPLALSDLEPLLNVIFDPTILKVLHSAHQDLEIFFHLRGAVPCPVFDTQLAATLLGQGEQVGYASLVKALLGVDLDKSQTRTDWSRRPLDAAQLDYAADDVRYLRDVYQQQRADLVSRQRLDWLAEDFSELGDPERYQVRPQEAWRRIKGSQQLHGVQLAALRALAAWREERAIASDRPRKWILGDDVLLELARHMPKNEEQLDRVRGLEPGTLKRHGQTLLGLLAAARGEPREQWPSLPPRHPLSPEQDALVDAMMALIRLRGAQQAVSPQNLASRKDLERLLAAEPDIPLLHGWRATLAGHEVQALLRGALRLEVHDGELRTVPSD
jgi:ribonuclease D